ncbi:hypothetical protein L1987_73573 [Smallanthus sonchifolius]|uniref:Uncharacterized protein n=1 Tax=Smallanthus sonchifolius TaxID=185202 RepID=A0ACB9A0G0_9ASTR|nr:hypothetical protein L1987_73573 [Smallanthus sonchifolius]
MGNYIETCIQREVEREEKPQQESGITRGNFGMESSRMRVKLVLTKDELEWLLLQMKSKEGKRLEDVLREIGKSRMRGKSGAGWKPCLESIMEAPEVHFEMKRS